MDQLVFTSYGDKPRLNVVWTAQDAVDALAAGVCDCPIKFSSTAAIARDRTANTPKHMQRFHEAAVVEYLRTRTLNTERYVQFSCSTVCSGHFL